MYKFKLTALLASMSVIIGIPLCVESQTTETKIGNARVTGTFIKGSGPAQSIIINSGAQFNGTGLDAFLGLSRFANNTANPGIIMGKSRGTAVGTNTIVQSGDDIGEIAFAAADGSTYPYAARILASVDGTPGVGDMPGRLVFSTTSDGASSPTERFRISNTGVSSFTGKVTISSTLTMSGQTKLGGTVPTVANNACGSTSQGTITAGGNDNSFKLTVGTTAVTSCTVSFGATWAAAPTACVLSAGNTAAAGAGHGAYVSSISTTQLVIASATDMSSDIYYIHCL